MNKLTNDGQQLYRTRSKYKGSKKFAAGHGAVKFVAGTNPAWTHAVTLRRSVETGELCEISSEPIATSMVAKLKNGMTPFAAI